MKITHELPENNTVSLAEMQPGQIGVDDRGHYYLASSVAAVCLNHMAGSFHNRHDINDHYVTILPPGTKITIEV